MEVVPRLTCPSWRWMMFSGTPSRASSTAWAWRSWCGANRRRTPASAARRRSSLLTVALDHGLPRVGPSITQNIGPTGNSTRAVSQGRSCSQPQASIPISRRRPPLPLRTSREPRCGSRSRSLRVSASWMRSPAAPEHDDQGTQASTMAVGAGLAHHRDDLLHRGRVGRVAQPLVARPSSSVVAGIVAGER
jgi:hypothetical protein